jgi:hypothetical protein
MQASGAFERLRFDIRGVEVMKWIALCAMLVEHVAHFAVGMPNGWPFVVGRLAFPLFTIALALGCAHKTLPELRSIVVRLAAWGVVAAVLGLSVRPAIPGNILFTFALGVVLHAAMRDVHGSRWFIGAVALLFASVVEYGVLGVVAVAVAMSAARQEETFTQLWLMLLALLLIACVKFNAPAIIAIPVVVALNLPRFRLPRARGVFYWAYALQWPLIAAVGWAL